MFGLLIAVGILTNLVVCLTAEAISSRDEVSSSSPSGWTLDQLMSLIAQNKLDELRFDETLFSDILSAPLKSSGTLRFIPPSRLEKHVMEPTDERYVIDGNDVLFEDGRALHPQRLSLQDYPSLRGFVEAFRASMSGDTAVLKQFYSTALTGDRRQWTLTLRPLDSSVQALIKEITLTGAEGRIAGLALHAANGDRSMLTLSRKQP
jgi:hypothetical protein